MAATKSFGTLKTFEGHQTLGSPQRWGVPETLGVPCNIRGHQTFGTTTPSSRCPVPLGAGGSVLLTGAGVAGPQG